MQRTHCKIHITFFIIRNTISNLFKKTVTVGVVKGCSALVGFILIVVVSRALGAIEAGYFLLGYTLVFALSGFFRLGLDNVILRYMGAEGLSVTSQEFFNKGLLWICMFVLPFTCLVALSTGFIAEELLSKPDFAPVLSWFILALPPITLCSLIAIAFQGLNKTITAILFQNLGLSSIFIFSYFIIDNFSSPSSKAVLLAVIFSFSSILVFLIGVYVWFSQTNASFHVAKFRDKNLWAISSNLWAASTMIMLVQWSGILVASVFVTSEELAYLTAAQRTAMLAGFVLIVVNMIVAPRYARLWKQNKIMEMERLAIVSTRAMICLVLPVVLFVVIFPEWIMGLFGEGFEEGAPLLIIIILGQFVSVMTGSVGYLLTMSGHEKDFRRVTIIAGSLTMLLAFLLTMEWGGIGASYATAIGLSVQNLLAVYMVNKRLGFNTLNFFKKAKYGKV